MLNYPNSNSNYAYQDLTLSDIHNIYEIFDNTYPYLTTLLSYIH